MGLIVVCLKGGDLSVFGRVGEEVDVFYEYGICYEMVLGIIFGIVVLLYVGIFVMYWDFVLFFVMIIVYDKLLKGMLNFDWEGFVWSV